MQAGEENTVPVDRAETQDHYILTRLIGDVFSILVAFLAHAAILLAIVAQFDPLAAPTSENQQ